MKIKLLVAGFVALSFGLAFWLFANWYDWSMADFDCVAGYWQCRQSLIGPMIVRLGLPIMAWIALAVLLVREWKKP